MNMSQYKNSFLGAVSMICISILLTAFVITSQTILPYFGQELVLKTTNDALVFFDGALFGCLGMLIFVAFMLDRKGFFKSHDSEER